MSKFNNQKQCVVCGEEQKENSIGLWIDVSDQFNLREGLAFVCGQVCKSLSITLTYPYNYSETVRERQKTKA